MSIRVVRLLLTIALAGALLPATAAPTSVFTSGRLAGFNDVSFNDILYDVAFVDGTCSAVYAGCDNASDDFPFGGSAEPALLALMDLLHGYGPKTMVGCDGPSVVCYILVPYERLSNGNVRARYIENYYSVPEYSGGFFVVNPTRDTSNANEVVFAVWSLSNVVPEPSSLPLALIAGLALFLSRRRSGVATS